MRLLSAALVAVLCASPLMAQTPAAAPSAQTGTTKIAVANLGEILKGLEEIKAVNTAMEGERASVQAEEKTRIEQINQIKAQRDQLKPDAPQWTELNTQFVKLRSEAQAWGEGVNREMIRKLRDNAVKVHEKITKAIDDVAKEKGIDLVLAEQKPEFTDQQLEQLNPQQVMGALFSSRSVLYRNASMDITQDVIKKLNASYKPAK